MVLIEDYPSNTSVARFVDRYQFYDIREPAFFKTVPNGKIECYLIKNGGFYRWDEEQNDFLSSNKNGFLPATNQVGFYRIPKSLICLNIKFKLNILSFSYFEKFIKKWRECKVTEIISQEDQERVLSALDQQHPKIPTELLDQIFEKWCESQLSNKQLEQLIQIVQHSETDDLKSTDIAHQMNMSTKTMERFVNKHFDLSPKELLQILRFEHTSFHLKKSEKQRLIDALAFGYYDQSHFNKECKRITGYSPKDFFSKLKLSTNDLIFENNLPSNDEN